MLVRREHEDDVEAVRQVAAEAFADPAAPSQPPPELILLDALRAADGWLPAFSLVATGRAGEVVGHVACTRADIAGTPALGLGPLAVRSAWQRRGVGRTTGR